MAKPSLPVLMQSYQAHAYGSGNVIQARAAEVPQPQCNEVLIQVKASSVTRGDLILRGGKPYIARLFTGLLKPKNPILGFEFSGVVVAKGEGVKHLSLGDRVMGCFSDRPGAYAQYLRAEAHSVQLIPESVSDEEAAVAQMGGLTALWFLNQAGVSQARRVLIIGASGAVGSAAVQIAKAAGANVTAVCHADAMPSVQALQADEVWARGSWNPEDYPRRFDLIFDASGKYSLKQAAGMMRNGGSYASTHIALPPFLKAKLLKERAIGCFAGRMKVTEPNAQQLRSLLALKQFRPLIDRCFEASQLAQAHDYVEQSGKIGNVPIRF